MKIAALVLASAFAAAAFGQPSFAQQNFNPNQNDPQFGQGMQGQNNQRFGNQGSTSGWNGNWRNGAQAENETDEGPHFGRMHHWGGRMGAMMRHHHDWGENETENEGARFNFSSGDRHMRVRCPSNESMQACVQAAGQLLDKIANLRNNAAASGSNAGSSTGSSPTTPGAGTATSPTGQ